MEIVVLIEGFSSTRGKKRFQVLVDEIKREFPGIEILIPEYFEGYGRIGQFFRKKTISEYAATVKKRIEKEVREKDKSFVLIGYSMGGLIVRYLVEKMEFPAKTVILIGTPNKGIKLSWWEKLLLKIINIPCIEDMKENSEFLRTLQIKSLPNYYWLGSDRDKRVPFNSSIPIEIRYNTKRYRGLEVLSTDHSGLIPMTPKKSKDSAIPAIIRILKKEIKA